MTPILSMYLVTIGIIIIGSAYSIGHYRGYRRAMDYCIKKLEEPIQ